MTTDADRTPSAATTASRLEALTVACEAALAHAEALRMDTPEDQAVVTKIAEALRLALAMGSS